MNIRELQKDVHALAVAKGWYEDAPHAGDLTWLLARLALVHSEASEASECVRDGDLSPHLGVTGKPSGLPSERTRATLRKGEWTRVVVRRGEGQATRVRIHRRTWS